MRTVATVSGPQAAAALGGLGLGNVTVVRAATGLDQDCFVSRMFVTIDGPPQGLFQLIRAKPLSPDDFAAVPRNANYVIAAKLDLSTVFENHRFDLGKERSLCADADDRRHDGLRARNGN